MAYYIFVENEKLNGCGQCECLNDDIQNIEVTEEVFNTYIEDNLRYIWDGENVIDNPNYEADKQAQYRQEIDQLTLTPSDVERALLKAKGWDFDDLKAFLKEKGYTDLQIKAIGVELRANDFFRGATLNNIRIVDAIGALLGYTFADMDYLFQHKELPAVENVNGSNSGEQAS